MGRSEHSTHQFAVNGVHVRRQDDGARSVKVRSMYGEDVVAVIFRGIAVFLEHPRTGSTATREALKRIGGQPHTRHAFVQARGSEKTVVTVRNPFDVLVSWWLIVGEREGYKNFKDFLLRGAERELMTKNGKLFYYDGDITMRYETLARDFQETLRVLGMQFFVSLRVRNTTAGKLGFRSYYTPELVKLVEEIYGEELERYGYSFC